MGANRQRINLDIAGSPFSYYEGEAKKLPQHINKINLALGDEGQEAQLSRAFDDLRFPSTPEFILESLKSFKPDTISKFPEEKEAFTISFEDLRRNWKANDEFRSLFTEKGELQDWVDTLVVLSKKEQKQLAEFLITFFRAAEKLLYDNQGNFNPWVHQLFSTPSNPHRLQEAIQKYGFILVSNNLMGGMVSNFSGELNALAEPNTPQENFIRICLKLINHQKFANTEFLGLLRNEPNQKIAQTEAYYLFQKIVAVAQRKMPTSDVGKFIPILRKINSKAEVQEILAEIEKFNQQVMSPKIEAEINKLISPEEIATEVTKLKTALGDNADPLIEEMRVLVAIAESKAFREEDFFKIIIALRNANALLGKKQEFEANVNADDLESWANQTSWEIKFKRDIEQRITRVNNELLESSNLAPVLQPQDKKEERNIQEVVPVAEAKNTLEAAELKAFFEEKGNIPPKLFENILSHPNAQDTTMRELIKELKAFENLGMGQSYDIFCDAINAAISDGNVETMCADLTPIIQALNRLNKNNNDYEAANSLIKYVEDNTNPTNWKRIAKGALVGALCFVLASALIAGGVALAVHTGGISIPASFTLAKTLVATGVAALASVSAGAGVAYKTDKTRELKPIPKIVSEALKEHKKTQPDFWRRKKAQEEPKAPNGKKPNPDRHSH